MNPEEKQAVKRDKVKQKITARELFSSPQFYVALFPHLVVLYFVLTGSLGYFYIFFIFYSELILENFILSFAILLTKEEQVQKIYKSDKPKSILATRSLIDGLLLCIFLGIFGFFIFYQLGNKNISIANILTNNIIWLPIGLYAITRMVNLAINKYNYDAGQKAYIENGKSFVVNIATLVIFVVPGGHILLLLKFLPINTELIAMIILFVIRAYADAGLVFQEKDIETEYQKLYN